MTCLDLSSLQAGKLELKLVEIDLDELITSVVSNMSMLALKKEIEILYNPIDNTPRVTADYQRLKQIFTIFLDNAIKYSPENTKIEISAVQLKDVITVIIRDHGYGIPQDELNRIWDQYYRTKHNVFEKGNGLGLAIAKQLIELHHYTVKIESIVDAGTTVTLNLNI